MKWEVQPQSVIVAYTKTKVSQLDPEYRRTRETRWEDGGGTTLQA